MATQPNAGFHQQAISFQSGPGPIASSSSGAAEMMSLGNYYNSLGMNFNVNVNVSNQCNSLAAAGGGGGLVFAANPCMLTTNNSNNGSSSNTSTNSPRSSSGSLIETVPGLKHDTGLAVEWSLEEQYKLEEGLAKYASEPTIMRYIKIAASLHDKTVRDVALRCRWMTRKRRKQEDYPLGKKLKDRKDKLMESSMKTNFPTASPANVVAYPFHLNHFDQRDSAFSPALLGTTRHLLEENSQALNQISANISTLKLQDNIDLFFRTRNNIAVILNDMKNMPGIMGQMPPLPVYLNDGLVSSILPNSAQPMMFGCLSGVHLKQEPGC